MRCLSNSNVPGHTAKVAELGSEVALPVMDAVNKLPQTFRLLVDAHGYVPVYRAWKRGMTPQQIEECAKHGPFALL